MPRLLVMRLISVSPRLVRLLFFTPLYARLFTFPPFTTRFPMKGLLSMGPIPPQSLIYTARLIAVLLILSLDGAFIVLLMRVDRPLSTVNPISPFLLASFRAFSFFLTASGFGCREPSVEFLILLPEDLH
jgi:hypothetical protein